MMTLSIACVIYFLFVLNMEVHTSSRAQSIANVNVSVKSGLQTHKAYMSEEPVPRNEGCSGSSLFCPSGNNSESGSVCYYCDGGQPICSKIPYHILRCIDEQVYILNSYCATYNERSKVIEVGLCIFNTVPYSKDDFSDAVYGLLPQNVSDLNKRICGDKFNRTGSLCGRCYPNFSLQAYSFDLACVECSNAGSNWWKLVPYVFLPLTVFFMLVLFFEINTTSSHLHGFIIFCQAVADPIVARFVYISIRNSNTYFSSVVKTILAFYGIWNLDLFRIFNHNIYLNTSTLESLSFGLAMGAYPLLFMALSYLAIYLYDRNVKPVVVVWVFLYRFFSVFRRNGEIRTSVVDAFATFFVLSHVKFLSVCFDLLVPIRVYQLSSSKTIQYSWKLYYDADMLYFGHNHLPYGIVATSVLVIFILFPLLSIFFYPFKVFQRCLNTVPFRWYILHTFMDSFQGYYKDGTEPGSRDCRWFASLFLLVRVGLLMIASFSFTSLYFVYGSMAFVVVAILIVIHQPFKSNRRQHSYTNFIFFMLLALQYLHIALLNIAITMRHSFIYFSYTMNFIISFLPIFYIIGLVVHWIISHRRFGCNTIRLIRAFCKGYHLIT